MVFPNEAKIIDPKLHQILQYTCTYVCFENDTQSHTLIIINTIINLCFLGPLEHYPQSIHTTTKEKGQ